MKLKVVSYNIMAGRSQADKTVRDFSNAAAVISEIEPDIVGLQEVGKHPTAGFPEYDLAGGPEEFISEKTGLKYNYFAKAIEFSNQPYGNAIISKYPIKSAKTVMIPDAERTEEGYYETRCVLVAEIDVAGGITVLVSHFGLMSGEHKNAVKTVSELIKNIKTPVVFMGDLNMTADNPDMKPIFDIIPDTAKGETKPLTWPSDMNENAAEGDKSYKSMLGNSSARKIDYIFASEHFKTKSISTFHSLASDHFPYIAELEIDC